MSRDFRNIPCRKRNRLKISDNNRNKGIFIQNLIDYYFEKDLNEEFILSIPFRNFWWMALIITSFLSSSCVSKKVLLTEQDKTKKCFENLTGCQDRYTDLESQNGMLAGENKDLSNAVLNLEMQLDNERNKTILLEQQLEYFKLSNTNLLDRLADLSVVSKAGAESIQKSLDALNEQNRYIKDLTSLIRYRDSLNLVLVMNLKRSLDDIGDEDINIEIKKGVVYISISDKLLFNSGSANISQQAETVLGKIAKVLNDHQKFEILVEGHTDSVPISTTCMADNWDLSVKRATGLIYTSNKIKIADLELDLEKKIARRGDRNIELTAKEFSLLEFLMRNKGKVVSRSEIAEKVWDITFDTGTNVVDVYINILRKKIDRDFEHKLIQTRIGLGYIINEP